MGGIDLWCSYWGTGSTTSVDETDGGLWLAVGEGHFLPAAALTSLPFQHHQQEDVGRAASESHLPLPSVHPLDLRTAGGRVSLYLRPSVPRPVHQVRTVSL